MSNEVKEINVVEAPQKEAVNVLDLLLGADIGKIKLPEKQVELPRLTEVFGAPFIVTCKALTPARYEEVQDMALDVSGKEVDLDVNKLQMLTVIEGVQDGRGKPLLKNTALMAKYGVKTPVDLYKKLFLSGEATALYTHISHLTGFGDDAVKEVKN